VARAEHQDTTQLSLREREVLYWAASGKTFEETGMILGISRKTVEAHMYKAMRKLDVYNTPQAVTKAILLGLIQP
jgi:DNA-binding CsgD family transcriptional regulator